MVSKDGGLQSRERCRVRMKPEKEAALRNRLRDKSWGYAIAHLIPLVWIYYAWTRRTLTPIFWVLGGNIVIGLFIGLGSGNQLTTDELETWSMVVGFVATPLFAKFGIESARIYANRVLIGKKSPEGFMHRLIFGKVNLDSGDSARTFQSTSKASVTTSEHREQPQSIDRPATNAGAGKVISDSSQEESELNRLKNLFDKGLIDENEYGQLKKRVLGL